MNSKIKKVLLGVFFVLVLIPVICFSASAQENKEGSYTYKLLWDGVCITDVDDDIEGEIVLPETLGGNEVTKIFLDAFNGCENITGITVPAGLKYLEVDMYGFPLDYEINPFSGCSNLEYVFVSEDNERYTSDEYGVLYSKDKTVLVGYQSTVKTETYTVPDSVTKIASGAFWSADGIKDIVIGKNVREIRNGALQIEKKSLERITVSEGNEIYCSDREGVLYDINKVELISYPSGKTSAEYTVDEKTTVISEGAFINCTYIKKVNIPYGVEIICDYAFSGCVNLKSVELPGSLKDIGTGTFSCCYSLTDIVIPHGVVLLGDTFRDCINLKTVTIPTSVARIYENTFKGCASLTDIYYKGTEKEWKKIEIYDKCEELQNAEIHYENESEIESESLFKRIIEKIREFFRNLFSFFK